MPSYRVAESTVSISIYDIVGQDGSESGFIGHSGLSAAEGSQDAAAIPIHDMGPPLHGQGGSTRLRADVLGSAILTDDEVQKIRTFVDRHTNEHLLFLQFSGKKLLAAVPQMYRVCPHAEPFREEDGRYARMRFSCAGFVFEAYKKAKIELLNTSALPMVGISDIEHGYPAQARLMQRGSVSATDLGLIGDGPWRVMFCGYLFHAVERDPLTVRREPYTPGIADRHFF